jgi:hypothetical protein
VWVALKWPSIGSSEQDSEPWGCIKDVEIQYLLSDFQFLNNSVPL